MKNQVKAYIFGGAVVLCWATVAAAFKITLRYISPYQLLFYSTSMSLFILFAAVVVQKKVKQILSLSLRELVILFFLGLLNPFLYFILLFQAYDLLPAQQAQPITYTWPIIMVLLAWPILKQKITRRDIVSVFLCYLGIFVIVTEGNIFGIHFPSLRGIIIALSSTLIWALYWVVNTRIKIDPVVALFMNFLFGFPFVVVTCLTLSSFRCDWQGIAGAFYVGVFEMGFAFIFWLYALKLAEKKSSIINLT